MTTMSGIFRINIDNIKKQGALKELILFAERKLDRIKAASDDARADPKNIDREILVIESCLIDLKLLAEAIKAMEE